MWNFAIIKLQVGEKTGFLIRAIGSDKGALVAGSMNETTLTKVSSDGSWIVV